MIPRTLLALGLLTLVVGFAPAQVTLQIPISPVQPGVAFTVVLTNNTSTCIDLSRTNVLTLLQPGGELISPVLVGCGPVGTCLVNGGKAIIGFTPPATGPGSAGSYVLLCPHAGGAAVRLNVGLPGSGFPDIHAYPFAIPHGPGGHHIPFPPGAGSWEFANTASTARVIAVKLQLFRPGRSTSVATSLLSALAIPANGVTRVSLPLTAFAAGPYTVQAEWIDPGTSSTVTSRHGIELSSGTSVDLHFPGGRHVARKASITARIAVPRASPQAPAPWPYVLAVGYQPGTTKLPGGSILPLAIDPLVVASVVNGINGILSSNVGATSSTSVYCAHSVTYYPTATGIRIAHPGPVLSGLRLRVGAIVIDPGTNAITASQPEEITLQ